jgi:hypothetical protein
MLDHYVTFLAGIFRSVRFGAASAHGRANMIQFNFFSERGAFARGADGRYRVDLERMREAVDELSGVLLILQGDGDHAGAGALLASHGVIRPELADGPGAHQRGRRPGGRGLRAGQVGAFLQKTGGIAPADALYVVQFGGNDVRDALVAAAAGADPLPILQAAAASIAASIAALHAAGARHFLVWNAPDVGLTPAVRILDAQIPGAAAGATFLSQLFNAFLVGALAPLQPLPGVSIVPFDAFALISAIHTNPGQFGLTNVTDPCLTPNVPPFTCSNPDEYLFWDGIHPTQAVHAIVAAQVAWLLGW